MYSHLCIKPGCANKYESTDDDRYYCPPCNEQRKTIARELDKKFVGHSTERPMTPLQEYDAQQKVRGFIKVSL